MNYVCPAWEFAMDTNPMKLQRLQSRALRTTDNFPGCTPIHDMHVGFQFLYVYNYVGNKHKSFEVTISNVTIIGQGKALH
jgi:hypothetical protein